MLANVSSPSSDLSAVAFLKPGNRRLFRATRKVSGLAVEFSPLAGRPGGDAGNRKRRDETRFECTIDHNKRLRQEERRTRAEIADGITEFRVGLHWNAELDDPLARKGKRRRQQGNNNDKNKNKNNKPAHAHRDQDSQQSAAPGKPQRHRSRRARPVQSSPVIATMVRRPRLTNAELRAMLGLAPKDSVAAAA